LTTYSSKSREIRRLETGRAVNQRVKSAIGTAKKIDTNSRPLEREKAALTAFRQSFRIALYPLFATKVPEGGGVPKKFTKG
jgi:hypothetical protein